MSLLPIESVDADGAIREAEEAVAGDTRADFFRKAAVGGGAVLGSSAFMGMLPEMAAAKPSKKQDIKILNFALTLEHLEAEFYRGAVQSGAISGDALDLAELILAHEAAHVTTLRQVIKRLGGKPVPKPNFDFQGTNTQQDRFIQTALVLENTGTRAYLGQAGRLKSRALLAAAGSILAVEARHAAAVATVLNTRPFADATATSVTPFGAFDRATNMKKILGEVGATNFIQS